MARVAEILGNNGVNIKSISTERIGKSGGVVRIIPNGNETDAARVLQEKGGYKVQVNPLLTISLIDRPGELAKISRTLGDVGVNINSIYIIGNEIGKSGRRETQVALNVNNFAAAEKVLKPFVQS